MPDKKITNLFFFNLLFFWLSFFLVRVFLIYSNSLQNYINDEYSVALLLLVGTLNDLMVVLPFGLALFFPLFFIKKEKIFLLRIWLILLFILELGLLALNFFDLLYFSLSRTHFHYFLVQYIFFAKYFKDSIIALFNFKNLVFLAGLTFVLGIFDLLILTKMSFQNLPSKKVVCSFLVVAILGFIILLNSLPKIVFADRFVENVSANSIVYIGAKNYCYRANVFNQFKNASAESLGLSSFRQTSLPANYSYFDSNLPLAQGPNHKLCQLGIFDQAACAQDLDGDGSNLTNDCDDSNKQVNPLAAEVLNNSIDENCDGLDNAQPNVILLVLESTGAKYITPELMPFLNQLKEENAYFNNFYSNGTNTARSIIASLCSIYTGQAQDPEINSAINVNMLCLPQILDAYGYYTLESQAGDLEYLNKTEFFNKIGFQNVAGKTELGGEDLFGWGITDKELYRRTIDKVDTLADKPFFLTMYGISVHHPYGLPPDANPLFPHDTQEHKIANLLKYTDDSLKLFFELAQDKPWFKNSIIVITADNSHPMGEREFNAINYADVYEENIWIPLVVVDNAQGKLKGERAVVASQIDIAPTILDYLGIDTLNHFQGKSLLKDNLDYTSSSAFSSTPFGGCMTAYREGDYKLLSRSFGSNADLLFNLSTDRGESTDLRTSLAEMYDNLDKKALQLYFNQYYLYENNKFWSPELQVLFEKSL